MTFQAKAVDYHLGEWWAVETNLSELWRVSGVTCELLPDGSTKYQWELSTMAGEKRTETAETFPRGWRRCLWAMPSSVVGPVVRSDPFESTMLIRGTSK